MCAAPVRLSNVKAIQKNYIVWGSKKTKNAGQWSRMETIFLKMLDGYKNKQLKNVTNEKKNIWDCETARFRR